MSERSLQWSQCSAPELYRGRVLPDWIDLNDHMNVTWYLMAFDYGNDGLWQGIGLNKARRAQTGSSSFAVESRIRYLNELMLDESFVICSRILAVDSKRMHQFQYLFSADSGKLSATCEWLHLHVNLRRRRVVPWPDDLLNNIVSHPSAKMSGPWPAAAGQEIKIERSLLSAEVLS